MLRNTTIQDVMEMAPKVRPEDEAEVAAIAGLSPLEALTVGLFHSKSCVTGLSKTGEIALIAGVVPLPQGASVWMIATPAIQGNAREVLREGRKWLDNMCHHYGVLRNVVDARNSVHLNLLKHMGFSFGEPKPNHGAGKILVIPFTRKLQNV